MKLTITQFAALRDAADVTIHSLEQALYQVTVSLPTGSHVLVDGKGVTIRSRNLQSIREMLKVLPVRSITLRHESAYDEMVGQPVRESSNALEVSISHENFPGPSVH
ncbi:MAG: DUF6482 family protein [Halioglobus sp.]|nr:DUF6482 family protein [Halioglobus sp.]